MQDNHSRSAQGTLRGLHAQSPNPQGKLVRVIEGEIWDVAVDVRRGSPAYGRFVRGAALGRELRAALRAAGARARLPGHERDARRSSTSAREPYDPKAEFGIAWNDPDLAIPWPTQSPLLSERDRRAPRLRDVQERLIDFSG